MKKRKIRGRTVDLVQDQLKFKIHSKIARKLQILYNFIIKMHYDAKNMFINFILGLNHKRNNKY
jgi:hypothetical protein